MSTAKRGICERAPQDAAGQATPEGRFRTPLLPKCALRRRLDAVAGIVDGIPYEKRPPAPISRRSSNYVRNCCNNAPSGVKYAPERHFSPPGSRRYDAASYTRTRKVAPCGYDYEPTFIRWVSSSPVPASSTTEDPLPGRDVGLPCNACRFTQFAPQGDDKTNVGERAPRCQS